MRTAMAQPCVNPAAGRLGSFSMPRTPWETSWGGPTAPPHAPPSAARGCPLGRWPKGAAPTLPGFLFPELSRSWDPPAAPVRLCRGWGAASPQQHTRRRGGKLRVCWGPGVQVASLQDTHPILGRVGCVPGQQTVPKGSLGRRGGSTAVSLSSRYPCVCVCVSVCCLPARCKSCLWLRRCCVDLPGDAHGRQPSSFPTGGFQGLPFTAETVQLIPPVGCLTCPHRPGSAPAPLGRSGSRCPGDCFS